MDDDGALRVGLIGAGRIGRLHGEHLAFRVPGACLEVVADVDAGAAEECAARCGGVRATADPDEVFADPGVDAVVIASATPVHADHIEAAARGGKAVFCEKPIDHDLARVDRALAVVAEAGVPLQIGFNRRFDPGFAAVERAVREGRIGEPHLIRITSRDPSPPPLEYVKVSGGLFFDMTIHDFDMARFLAGSEPVWVFAAGGVRVDPAIGEVGDIDTAVVTIGFEDGVLATIDNSRQAVYGYDQRVEVFGSGGVVAADNEAPHRTVVGDREGMHAPLPLHFFMERYTASYLAELEAFVGAVWRGTAPPVGGPDGRAPIVMAMAAARSLEEGRRVGVAK